MSAKTIAFVFSFILPLLVIRRLSPVDFGLYKQVFLVVGTAIVVLPLGFGMSAFYFLARERERQGQIVFNIVLFNALVGGLACVTLVANPRLLLVIFNSPELVAYGPLIGLVILFWTVASFLEIVPVANEETTLATVFIISAQLTKTGLLVAAALIFNSVGALVYAALLQGILQTLLLFVYLRSRFHGFWRRFDWAILRMQCAYAMPLGAAGVLYAFQNDLHSYFVANRFGPATYAIYAIGCFELPLVGVLAESICSVMLPRVSYLQKHDEKREIVLLAARVTRKLSAVYLPLYVFLMIGGREIIAFLFTPTYLASWPIFAINLTLLPFYSVPLDPISRAHAAQRYFLLRLKIAMFIALVAALWLAIGRFGLLGAISVVVAVNLIERFATMARMARALEVSRRDLTLLADVGKIAVAAIIAGAMTALVRSVMLGSRPFFILAVCGSVFSLVYIAAVLLFGIVADSEREAIWRQVTRRLRPAEAGRPIPSLE